MHGDMTNEMATMQRITEALREENARLQKKVEAVTDLSSQRMQEVERVRRQLSEQVAVNATHKYEVEEMSERQRLLEGERDQMLERFNDYGQEMQRRQDEIIDRVKRELRVKVSEVVARAENAERERDVLMERVEETKEMQE